jgi:hypothetical protein
MDTIISKSLTYLRHQDIISVRVIDFIHYKKYLILLRTYVVAFDLLILQGFHIKYEELIGQKFIFILQGIMFLFSKNSSTIIYLRYFSLSYTTKGEK